MKLKCKKCGAMIAVPSEVKRAADPRVECPQCQTGYRLRKGTRKGNPGPQKPPTGSNFTVTPSSFPDASKIRQAVQAPEGSAGPSSPWSEPPADPSAGPPPTGERAQPGLPAPTDDDAPTQLLTPSSAEALEGRRQASEMATTVTPFPTAAHPGPSTQRDASPATAPPSRASTPQAPSAADGSQLNLHTTPGGGSKLQAFQPGTVLAERYRIVRFLAHGGMGEVYEAEDLELKERLALKTISPAAGATQDVATIDRFKREIALARAVTHPNVCRIFDLGQHTFVNRREQRERVNFLTMELLQGETLSARLRRRKRLSPSEALPLVQQMASALEAAHAAKVVHRDFKSENVFLVPVGDHFRVVVTDFGVARGSDGADRFAAQVTGTGIVGTPSYMAPEQVEGKEVTPAADIYAFGVVIYEMLTGCLPFEGPTPLSTAVKRLQEAPPTPRIHVPDIPGFWERTIMRCLERQPEDRYATAQEVAASLTTHAPPAVVHETGSTPVAYGAPPQTSVTGLGAEPPASPTQVPGTRPPLASPPSPASGGAPIMRPGTAQAAASAPGRQKALAAVLALVLLVSAGLFLFNQFKDRDRRVAPRRSVAVLGFKNLTGQPDADWLATALTEMLATEMARGEALRSVASDNVARVRQELEIDDVSTIEPEQLAKIRSLLACDFVVSGSYTYLGGGDNGLRVDLRLRDAALGESVATASRQGAEGDLFPMAAELGEEVRQALGIGEAGEDAFAGLPTDGEAARLYAEALERMRASDPGRARQLLQQAVGREPTNALLHSALSSAWEAEGYRARAAQSAERAFELSSQLPQEDRLVVEGHFREIQGDWQAASHIYSSLWEFFPDDLDYGLRLVAAQNNAREPAAALAAIDRLRSLPAPLSEDPRIDLAEATSAALLGDIDRQLAAADRALDRAQQLGANLLMAQAQIARSQAFRRLGRMTDAERAANAADNLYTALDHPAGAAMARTALANALTERGSFDEAAQHFRFAIETYRTIGDQATTATGLNNLAMALRKKGDLDSAQSLYQEAVTIYEETDNRLGLANTENNLGVLWVGQDRLADALGRFQQTREVWEEHGDRAMQAFALNNIAAVSRLQGKLWESRNLHQQALEIRRDIGHKTGEVISLTNLAGLLLDLGELDGSEEYLEQGQQLADEIGDRAGQAEVAFRRAQLHLVRDQLPEARTAAERAIELRQELEQERLVADARLLLARIQIEQGDTGEAETVAREVLHRHRTDQRPGETALALEVLAHALAVDERYDEAQSALAEALLLAADSERRFVGLQLELTASLVEASAGRTTANGERLAELEEQIEADGYEGLRLEAAYVGGKIARLAGRRTEATQRLTQLEAEASAAGFALLARKAGEAIAN